MAIIEIRICDQCKAQGDVTTWTIGQGGETRDIDLCKRHAQPLEHLWDPEQRRVGGSPIRHMKIVTPEQIEQLRQKQQ